MYPIPSGIPLQTQDNLGSKGYFFVGGEYAQRENGSHYMYGQMYVEAYVPKKITQPYPLVFFSGAGQTGTTWMGTPDGRRGWADMFIDRGYVVYVTDVPTRGRSAYQPEADGELEDTTVETINSFFVADKGSWPTANLHTQWPKSGEADETMGEEIFDEFFRSQTLYVNVPRTQALVRKAGKKLLERIGPAIIITHSMAGPFGWLIADECPTLVKGIVSMEPSGPPFAGTSISVGRQREYGITDVPITYDPPINLPEWRKAEGAIVPPSVEEVERWMQAEPAGQLVNLVDIPITIMTGEASYHMPYDYITAEYMKHAGVKHVDYIRLNEIGIYGNGHMCMVEKNNDVIFEVVNEWIQKNVK